MQTQIVSKGIDVSPALRDRIEGRIDEVVDKYIHRDGEANVAISQEGTGFKVLISLHLPSGALMQSHADGHDAYSVADEALGHLEKRLRRYKRRLKDHQAKSKAEAAAQLMATYVLENPVKDDEEDDEDIPAGDNEPLVIAEKKQELRTMTVGMAALELGLTDSGALVFKNAGHGRVNVVFKRTDGHIGWIDPQS